MNRIALTSAALAFAAFATAGCPTEEGDPEVQAVNDVKLYVAGELLDALHAAALAMQDAAPAPDADGWSSADDENAVLEMQLQWGRARASYERVEGAIAVLFPDLDASTDERYDGFIAEGADDNLFDGEGATGVHAIERILWSDQIPANVTAFEEALPGYVAAAFPASEDEARDFKEGLAQRLVDDTLTMKDDFAPLALDTATAYRGVIGSIEEQIEKVSLAETGEDESRYAQFTLADMRANLEGGEQIYEAFDALFESKGEAGEAVHNEIHEAFERIGAHYEGLEGDGIPPVPATWNPDEPSADDLATDYGALFTLLSSETDPDSDTSLVSTMLAGGELLGIPQL